MTLGVRWYLVGSFVLVALIALVGCSHYMLAEREPWRHDAEIACLNSGAVKESPTRVRISSISGPGACGADYPLRVSALGESGPLGYSDEAPVPPGAIPNASMPQHWPVTQPSAAPSSGVSSQQLPPLPAGAPQAYPSQPYPQQPYPQRSYPQQSYPQQGYPPPSATPVGQPLSLNPPGLAPPEDDEDLGVPGGPPHPYYGGPTAPYTPAPPSAAQPVPPLGPPRDPLVTGAAGPVEVKPPATLACPIVSELDQWITASVQPAALKWFRQPVVEIKQISAYSCRGMNGNPNAHISEHAFGNALDIAEFTLADGHKVSVQYGWHGTPEEQGFLHDVQAAACEDFTTVLAPGANVYHYNHIHVDLMRHYNGRHICEPAAIPGEVVAERARARFAAQHGEPAVTGSIDTKPRHGRALGYTKEDDDGRPEAVPGDD
ncbi:MAG TPA: extensin family protein [Xanthobacteraceae bacterium]|nr:extensin family protein [Xanthobacteraceae bacterium]